MEVKIDVDELCELRSLVTLLEHSNKHKQDTIDSALSSIRNLSTQLAEAHAKNVDYHVRCDWTRVREERDWWRDATLSYEKIILDSVKLLDDGPLYSSKAEKLGYEVPE